MTNFNEDVFDVIDTEEKAYWLGWMLSDGYVTERPGNRQPSIGLKLKASDKIVLDRFKKFLGTPNKISVNDQYANLRIYSKKLADSLAKYTVTPRKSATTRLPMLEEELMPHLLRGLLDGDGWISKIYWKRYKKGCRYGIGWCSKSLITNDIMLYLHKTLGLSILKTKKKTWKGNEFYQAEYSGKKDCVKLFHYLYDNATIWLERKRNVMQDDSEVTDWIA